VSHRGSPVPAPSSARSTAPSLDDVERLLGRPLLELVFEAATVHRRHHDPAAMQCSQLLSIKTGACPEDCSYCSQSSRYKTPVERESLLEVDAVLAKAREAKQAGADRFCMGAAWREVKDGPEFDRVLAMVRGVKKLGLQSCVTLGMLDAPQARRLKDAGLDYYNHNLDTGRSHYGEIVSTHTFDDRVETLGHVRDAGIHVCCGGILGLGEPRSARAELLHELASLEPQPESVPINTLVPIAGTPLEKNAPLDWTEVVRTVAAARILMPDAVIRLSAGRTGMTEEGQALCFLAGANSIFVGDELLTTPNPGPQSDAALLGKLGLTAVAHCDQRDGA
jgi:biotin synthase